MLRKVEVHGVTKAKNKSVRKKLALSVAERKITIEFQCNYHRCPCWSLYWKGDDRSLIGMVTER